MTDRKDRKNDLDDLTINMAELETLATACAVRAGIHRQRVLIEQNEIDHEISIAYEQAIQALQTVHEQLKPAQAQLKLLIPRRRFFGLFAGSKT